MPNFLKLDDLLLPAPLPAVVAVLIVAGLAHLGWRLSLRIRKERATRLDFAGGFILMTACAAGLVHGLAIAQLSTPRALRVVGWALAAVGAYEIVRHGRSRLAMLVAVIRRDLSEQHWIGRVGLILAYLCVLCLLLAALGPPTDIDSLDYHLGVPLDWLGHGGAYPRLDWLHARLVGTGEQLNMLGLASGTDVLGAVLQASALFVAAVTVASIARGAQNRAFGILIALTAPVLLFLVPNQKPQLLPAVASTLGLVILIGRAEELDLWTLVLAFSSAAFAMSCKYSFLITGGVVILAGLVIAWRRRKLRIAIAVAMIAFCVLVVPNMVRSILLYGDPFSPLLEKFRAFPDSEVVAFAKYLRAPSGDRSLIRFLFVPVSDGLARAPGNVTRALGLGVLAVFTVGRLRKAGWWLMVCSVMSLLPMLAGVQLDPRFFMEPYLWVACAVVSSDWTKRRGILSRAFVLQALVVACMAGYGAISLFPGSLSMQLRDKVMRSKAFNYEEARWVDGILPSDSIILTEMRAHALVPRPFINFEAYSPENAPDFPGEKMRNLLESHGPTVAVFYTPYRDNLLIANVRNLRVIAGPMAFHKKTRNPWNAGFEYSVQVYDVSSGCK